MSWPMSIVERRTPDAEQRRTRRDRSQARALPFKAGSHNLRPSDRATTPGLALARGGCGVGGWGAGVRSLAPWCRRGCGWDAEGDGCFWCVGLGGYGIQPSPAAGRLPAGLIAGRDPDIAVPVLAAIDPRRFRAG